MVFLLFIFIGFKYNNQLCSGRFETAWFMFPISLLISLTEIISFFTRQFSLGLRLFSDVFSKKYFSGTALTYHAIYFSDIQ